MWSSVLTALGLLTVDEHSSRIYLTLTTGRMLAIKIPICCLAITGVAWTPFIFPIINQNLHLYFCATAQSSPCVSYGEKPAVTWLCQHHRETSQPAPETRSWVVNKVTPDKGGWRGAVITPIKASFIPIVLDFVNSSLSVGITQRKHIFNFDYDNILFFSSRQMVS